MRKRAIDVDIELDLLGIHGGYRLLQVLTYPVPKPFSVRTYYSAVADNCLRTRF
jgi:hypothetical protein